MCMLPNMLPVESISYRLFSILGSSECVYKSHTGPLFSFCCAHTFILDKSLPDSLIAPWSKLSLRKHSHCLFFSQRFQLVAETSWRFLIICSRYYSSRLLWSSRFAHNVCLRQPNVLAQNNKVGVCVFVTWVVTVMVTIVYLIYVARDMLVTVSWNNFLLLDFSLITSSSMLFYSSYSSGLDLQNHRHKLLTGFVLSMRLSYSTSIPHRYRFGDVRYWWLPRGKTHVPPNWWGSIRWRSTCALPTIRPLPLYYLWNWFRTCIIRVPFVAFAILVVYFVLGNIVVFGNVFFFSCLSEPFSVPNSIISSFVHTNLCCWSNISDCVRFISGAICLSCCLAVPVCLSQSKCNGCYSHCGCRWAMWSKQSMRKWYFMQLSRLLWTKCRTYYYCNCYGWNCSNGLW